MDDKNTALNPSGDNMSSPLTPSSPTGASTPTFHSDMDVPPPPADPASSGSPAPFTPPVVHEEVADVPAPTPVSTPTPDPISNPTPSIPSPTPAESPATEALSGSTTTGAPASPGGNFGGLPPVITPPKKGGKGKIFAAVAGIILLLISVPVGVVLVRQNLELREKAGGECNPGEYSRQCNGGDMTYDLYQCNEHGDWEYKGEEADGSVCPPSSGGGDGGNGGDSGSTPTDAPSQPTDAPAQPTDAPSTGGNDGGSSGNDDGGDNGAAQQDQKVAECVTRECDTAIGKLVCVDTWQRPDGSQYPYAGSIVGDCQQDPPSSGGTASLPDECAYPGQPSEEAGDSETPNCGGHKYCHYEGSRLVWGTYQCNFCTNGATNAPSCNNNIGECGNEGGVCVGSSGVCANQGGYTSDASCNNTGVCCMGAAGSPSAPSSPGGNGSGTAGSTVVGTVGTGDCIATIAFEGVNQAWRQPDGSPVTVCAPTSSSVSLTMVISLPNNCPAQTVTWNETNATCAGNSYSMCPGPAGTPCSATPVRKAGQVVGGAPLRQTITTTSPSCGSAQIDMDNIAINGIQTNYGEGIRAFQSNCGANQCVPIKVYKYPYDAQFLVSNVNSLKPGDAVKFCMAASGATPQIRINGGSARAAQENGPEGSKCLQYDIPGDATTLRVTGEI